MAEKKDNKKLYICIAAVVVVLAIVVGVVIAKGSGNSGDNGSNDNGSSQATGLKASDLKNVDVEIEYGDYDGMYTLSKSIQNGEMTGKVVKIEGKVSHPMSTYSVVESNEGGTGSIGTQFIIEGDAEYPNDKDRIVITGKVVENTPMYFVIKTLPEFIEVKE